MYEEILIQFQQAALFLPACYLFSKTGGYEFFGLTRFDPFKVYKPVEKLDVSSQSVDNAASEKQAFADKIEPNLYETVWPDRVFFAQIERAVSLMQGKPLGQIESASVRMLEMELERLQQIGLINEFLPIKVWNDAKTEYETFHLILLPAAKLILAKAENIEGELYCTRQQRWFRKLPDGSVKSMLDLNQEIKTLKNQIQDILKTMGIRYCSFRRLMVLVNSASSLHIARAENAPGMDFSYLDQLQAQLTITTNAEDDFSAIAESFKRYEQVYCCDQTMREAA